MSMVFHRCFKTYTKLKITDIIEYFLVGFLNSIFFLLSPEMTSRLVMVLAYFIFVHIVK